MSPRGSAFPPANVGSAIQGSLFGCPSPTIPMLKLHCPSPSAPSSSSSALGRKRPTRICIPVAVPPVGFAVKSPEERVKEVVVDGDGYSVYSMTGARGVMEDRFSPIVGLHGDSKHALFGVFDGHGGAKAVEFAAKNMHKNIIEQLMIRREEETEAAIQQAYSSTDSEFLKEGGNGGEF